MHEAVHDFLLILTTVDPAGTLSIFIAVTLQMSHAQRRRAAIHGVIIAAAILYGFMLAGQLLLSGIGVHLDAFQLSGGIILFLVGLQMVFGVGPAVQAPPPERGHEVAVFPLAIPSIASPGSILAVVVLTDNNQFSMGEQAVTGVALFIVLAITLAVLLMANLIHRAMGNAGAAIVVRLMGLILCALAAEQVVDGVQSIVSGSR